MAITGDTSILQVNGEHLPDDLKQRRQWVTWRVVLTDTGKLTKQPTIPGTGYRNPETGQFRASNAASDNPETWRSFDQALAAYERGEADGIGFVFTSDDPYIGIDIDSAVDDGEVAPWAQAIVEAFGSYTELSPSGTGLHIISRGVLPPGDWANKRGSFECYDRLRFFTMTGQLVEDGNVTPIRENPEALLAFLEAHLKREPAPQQPEGSTFEASGALPDDETILAKARAAKDGADFIALWDGTDGDADWSKGDLKLLRKLYFWCGRHCPTMKRLFLMSERARRDKIQERPDYLVDRALDEIFNHPGECYAWAIDATLRFGKERTDYQAHEEEHSDREPEQPGLRTLAHGLGISAGAFVSFRQAEDGLRITPIANFTCRITHDVVKEDGVTTLRFYEVEAVHQKGEIRTVTVPASEFHGMAWVARELGPEWIVYAGTSTRDKVRQCIQHLTTEEGFEASRVCQHTGWIMRDGEPCYLMASGAIDADGLRTDVLTELPGKLALYDLPAPISGAVLRADALKQLRILEVGPAEVVAPAYGIVPAAILNEIHPIDFTLHMYGKTGVFKTELSAVMARHQGPKLTPRQAISAHSTVNAMERLAFAAKDALLLIDDFVPEGSPAEQARMRGGQQRLVRTVANGGGRGRLQRDATMGAEYFARCGLVMTGEDAPGGHSATGRMLLVEVKPGDIDSTILAELQQAGDDGAFARVTASVIRWIAANWDTVKAEYPANIAEHLAYLRQQPTAHSRHPDALAILLAASGMWLHALQEMEAITAVEADAAWERVRGGLDAVGRAQAEVIRDADPCDQFLRFLGSAIAAGDAHLCDPEDNGQPAHATVCGWTMQLIRTRDGAEPDYRPRGPRVGWIDGRGVWLLPDAALAVAQTAGRSQGIAIPWTSKTLGKRLQDGSHLLTAEAGRNTQKIRVAGSLQRAWHIDTGRLIERAPKETINPEEPTPIYSDRRRETA